MVTINFSEFPKLKASGCTPKSNPDEQYNCIAWAAGEDHRWWEPFEGRHWPVPTTGSWTDYSVESLVSAYATLGFVECDGDLEKAAALEPGIQKIALYGRSGEYLHASRQLKHGEWTSKLGPEDDIRHSSPDAVEGGSYGQLVKIMKRPYPDGVVLGDD